HAPTYGLYSLSAEQPHLDQARELVPPRSDAVLDSFSVVGKCLVLTYLERATSRLRIASLVGTGVRDHALPGIGSLFGLGSEWDGVELFYGFSSYTVPPSVYRIDLRTGEQSLWRTVNADLDSSRYAVHQVTYASRDATSITMFVVEPRDVR